MRLGSVVYKSRGISYPSPILMLNRGRESIHRSLILLKLRLILGTLMVNSQSRMHCIPWINIYWIQFRQPNLRIQNEFSFLYLYCIWSLKSMQLYNLSSIACILFYPSWLIIHNLMHLISQMRHSGFVIWASVWSS